MAGTKKRHTTDSEDSKSSKKPRNSGPKNSEVNDERRDESELRSEDEQKSDEAVEKGLLSSVDQEFDTASDRDSVTTFDRRSGNTFGALLVHKKISQETENSNKPGQSDHNAISQPSSIPPSLTHKTVYLEDLDTLRVDKLPDICEVTDVDAQDEILLPGYAGLPRLRQGSFKPWDKTPGRGHPMFSTFWTKVIPEMRIWNCVDAIQFVQSDRIINPSRISPMVVNARRSSPDGFKLRLYSFPSAGLAQHQLRGVVHSQEWDRLVGFFCMVFHQPELSAQLYMDCLAFTTKTTDNPRASDDMYRPSWKTSNKTSSSPARKSDGFLLNADDPVYDARHIDFDLSKDVNKVDHLPLFKGEIPKQSFAVIGYTASCYRSAKDGTWHFSANLLWAIVLGCRQT